jgi:hypothetical protein
MSAEYHAQLFPVHSDELTNESNAAFAGPPGCHDELTFCGPPTPAFESHDAILKAMARLSLPPSPPCKSITIVRPQDSDVAVLIICVREDFSTRLYRMRGPEFGEFEQLLKSARENLRHRDTVATPDTLAAEILGIAEGETVDASR